MTASKLILGFSGSIELDRADDHLALLEAMALGRDIDLAVVARISSKGFVHSVRISDGEEDVVAYQAKVKVVGVDAVR